MYDGRLRVLHLTDLHLRRSQSGTANQPERLSREIPDLLQRLADRLHEWAPNVIAMTGDLLDVPEDVLNGNLRLREPTAGAEAVGAAFEDYRWIRKWLDSVGVPWVVIPGNHDHRRAFSSSFQTASPDVCYGGWRFIGFDDDLDPGRTPTRFNAERHRFQSVCNNDASPQIHLQHYMLRPRLHRRTPYSYKPAVGLVTRIEATPNVRLVLSGHYHPGAYAKSTCGVVYSTAPAFCETPFRFRLIDLLGLDEISIKNCSVK